MLSRGVSGVPEYSPHAQAMLRLTACSTTLRSLILNLEDPNEEDLRVDLLISCDEVINQANQLYLQISEMTWKELDRRNHPSSDNA